MTDARAGAAFEIELPPGWSHRTDLPPPALVARPDVGQRRMVPSIDVVERSTTSASVTAYAQREVEALTEALPGIRVLLCDASPADDHGALGTLDLFLAGQGDSGLRATFRQRHLLTGDGGVLVATATAADVDWLELAPVLTASVTSVRAVAS
jgi:hypothetical protein